MKMFQVIFITFCSLVFAQTLFSQAPSAGLPNEPDAAARLNQSPRHAEWVTFASETNDKVEAWVVYPERKDNAPVIIVIHEIFGLSDWARAAADQFAAEGYIAIAPDFLSGKAPGGKGSAGLSVDDARKLNSELNPDEVMRRLNGAVKYASGIPSANGKYAVIGFCWGGGMSFLYATRQPGLSAAVVCYGPSPDTNALAGITAPVLGLYGGNDNRIDATIPSADNEMKRLKKSYEYEIYPGAGHAFFRQQDGMKGANGEAAKKGWKRALEFLNQAFKK